MAVIRVGETTELGTTPKAPTLGTDDPTIDPPTGDAAIRLWYAVTAWLEFPHLFELQRPKTPAHLAAIGETFRPYIEARDWVSINRGKEVAFTDKGFEVVGDA